MEKEKLEELIKEAVKAISESGRDRGYSSEEEKINNLTTEVMDYIMQEYDMYEIEDMEDEIRSLLEQNYDKYLDETTYDPEYVKLSEELPGKTEEPEKTEVPEEDVKKIFDKIDDKDEFIKKTVEFIGKTGKSLLRSSIISVDFDREWNEEHIGEMLRQNLSDIIANEPIILPEKLVYPYAAANKEVSELSGNMENIFFDVMKLGISVLETKRYGDIIEVIDAINKEKNEESKPMTDKIVGRIKEEIVLGKLKKEKEDMDTYIGTRELPEDRPTNE